ncbi:hypothetical protein GGI42DRAFT_276145 [Trichoderma sp. SZMC 28013]
MIPSNEHPMSVTEACVCRRIKHSFLFGIRCLCTSTVITLTLAPNANAGRTYAYSYLRLMPSLSRYANMEVSCLLHLYQYDDATWVRPIHISAACVPGRVPVATDPCLQASSFCRQVKDTAQLALFHVLHHVLHHVSCIVQYGEEAACSWDSLAMPIYPSSRRRPESAAELPRQKGVPLVAP